MHPLHDIHLHPDLLQQKKAKKKKAPGHETEEA